jgi:lipoprotein-anchoring transpeptidase ErfK/SrfK
MRRWSLAFAAVLLVLVLGGAVAVYAYDSSREDVIANGVRIGGLEVGGMSSREARRVLRSRLERPLRRPLTIRQGGRSFTLSPREAAVRVEVAGAVQEALARSRRGNVLSRAARDLTGGELDAGLTPEVTYSQTAVGRFVAEVERQVGRPARDARVEPSAARLRRVPGRDGLAVRAGALRRMVAAALRSQQRARSFAAPTAVLRPRVTIEQLAARYPYFITVDRTNFRLRLFKRLRRVKTYVIAVGRVGFETPEGVYRIQNKAVNPAWSVPDRPWAGALAGKVIPPGPDNPIKSRWMGIYDGAGIHGTDDTASLGTAASRGCIRMSIPEVEALYDRVPVGTPVYIG